ncbi:protein-tyrosine phosphatase-like protein [Roridomyces roridus]|uniref:Protein-tyrosine phosphatase-like protein n=1 Tax=Roridomyces roridus TaxID=1738132 RepID=A0AAD7B872_9AGAR|nr:protein-tyrosine phosphatase-like protein [Roridomyces roridus]
MSMSSSSSLAGPSSRGIKRKPSALSLDISYALTHTDPSPTGMVFQGPHTYHAAPLSAPTKRRILPVAAHPTASDSPLAPMLSNSHETVTSYSALTPHLSVADLAFAEDATQLRRMGITHVVSVLDGQIHIPSHIPKAHHLHVPLGDTPFAELVGALGPIVSFVSNALRGAGVIDSFNNAHLHPPTPETPHPVRILIHCAEGISRSPAAAAALLIALPLVVPSSSSVPSQPQPQTQRLSAAEAIAHVSARRPQAHINWGFRRQLGEWEVVCRSGTGTPSLEG